MENNIGDYRLLASVEETNILPIDEIGSNVNTFLLGAEKNYAYDKKGNLREVKGNKGVDYSSLFEMEERANTLFNHPDNNRMMNHYDDVVAPQRYTSNIRNLAKENRMQAREARIQNRYSSSQIQTKPKEERIGYLNKPVSSNKSSYLNFSSSLNNQNEIVMKPKKKEKNYEEIANVFYPDMPEVSQIKARAKKEMYEIEKERWTEHAKNFAGAGLEIGSSLIPAVKGVKIANTVAKAIAPKVGKKISQEIASGLVSGGLAGGVFGLGEGLLQDENPIITALEGLALGSATGALGDYGLGQMGKKLARTNAVNNPSDVANYVADYLEEVMNLSKNDLQDLRAFRVNRDLAKNKSSLEFDTPDNYKDIPEEFDIEKVMNLAENLKQGKYNPLNKTTKKVKIEDIDDISSYDKEYLRHELNNNLTEKEKKKKILKKPIGDYIYTIENNGFDNYKYINKVKIDDIYN